MRSDEEVRKIIEDWKAKERTRMKVAYARYKVRHPERRKARQAVFSAVRAGRLYKTPCYCGDRTVEAHHADYSRPLIVKWLCRKHHIAADKKVKARQDANKEKAPSHS